MYDLCGVCSAFPHTGPAPLYPLSIFLSEDSEFSPFHWLTGEVTDRPPATGVCVSDGRCGDLIQSEHCTHVSLFSPDADCARSHIWRFYCSSVRHIFILAKYWLECSKCFIFYCFIWCTWKMFDTLEHHNIIITTVRSGKPDSDVILKHVSVIDSTPQNTLPHFAFTEAMSKTVF